MAKKKPELSCVQNPKTKEWYWGLKSHNSRKVQVGGEGFKRKFTEADKDRLIALLMACEIKYYPAPKKKEQ
jgi:hypothetical protein